MIQSKTFVEKSTRDLFARIISDFLNPLTLPLLVFGMASLVMNASNRRVIEVMGSTAFLFLFIPLLSAIFIKELKNGRTLDFHERALRTNLYLVSLLSVGVGGLIFFDEIFTSTYSILLITYLLNLSVAFLVNFLWKASVHVGSAVTAAVMLSWLASTGTQTFWPAVAATLLTSLIPFLAWSRLHPEVHNGFEIVLGAVSGLISTILALSILT
ncbi:hypothetical protein [Rhodohalobacter sulfatireducens]|uniref:Uncharacterized protein n=1 Tax=Rhodohalobacter sulfatireducens TaxID=2911366 RepID=A0ABS9KEI4_9BACT|nr:hypothetical protein [Rhodohalobacter sulfatireducens]MCG2589258.1 hypothetical protein [Rhodohalobacter sulfatireducens]